MVDLELLNILFKETIPSSHEEHFQDMLEQYINAQELNVLRDLKNNIFVRTDEKSKTLFTAHTDDVSNYPVYDGIISSEIEGQTIHSVEPVSQREVLGADNKAGVYLLMKMIGSGIPGLYAFFVEEEINRLGSKYSLQQNPELYKGIKRAVSFDRKGTADLIVTQKGEPCCSATFAKSLIKAFGQAMPEYPLKPANGVATDSLTFVSVIPECTNISIGYAHAHSKQETLDLRYLGRLEEAVLKINWEILPTVRQF